MELSQIQLGLETLSAETSETYENYHNSKTEYDQINKQDKTVLACYELKHSETGKSQAEIQRLALADPEYKEYLRGLNEARKIMNKALAKVKTLEIRLSCYQSLSKNYLKEYTNQ